MGAIIAAIVTLIVYGIMAAFGAMLELSISLIAVIVVGALIVVSFVFTLGVSIFGPITVHSSPPPPKHRRRSNVRIRPYTPLSEEEIDEYLSSKASSENGAVTEQDEKSE